MLLVLCVYVKKILNGETYFFNKEKLLKIKFKKEWKKKIYLDENEINEEGLRKLRILKKTETFNRDLIEKKNRI